MRALAVRWFFALGGVLGLTRCDDAPLGALKAQIAFEPAEIDFGEVSVGRAYTRPVEIVNGGEGTFIGKELVSPEGFSLRLEKGGDGQLTVGGGMRLAAEVVFAANAPRELGGEFILRGSGLEARLKVRAVAVDTPTPELRFEPPALDFGTVAVGSATELETLLVNEGEAPGVIERYVTSSGGALFKVVTPLPVTAPPGGSVPLRVSFSPSTDAALSDVLVFAPGLELPVKAQGQINLGDFSCAPSALGFGEVARGDTKTLDVVCTAGGGPVRLVSAQFSGAEAALYSTSARTPADVAAGEAVTLPVLFRPDGLPREAKATLTIAFNGASGVDSVEVPIQGTVGAPPAENTSISIELTWNNYADVDVHLLQPGGTLDIDIDGDLGAVWDEPKHCGYPNPQGEWGDPGTADDCFLDKDDQSGFGPEKINVDAPQPGTYQVILHAYRLRGLTSRLPTAKMKLFLAGEPADELEYQLTACGEAITVWQIDWGAADSAPRFRRDMTRRGESLPEACGPGD